MLSDETVILITLMVDIFIIFYAIFDLYANRRAFNSVREILFRFFIPLLLSTIYLIPFVITGFNMYSLLIFVQFGFNCLIAVILWESEAFLGMTLDLEKIGRVILYLHFYFEDSQILEVNLYKWVDDSTTLNGLVKLIDNFGIFNRERKQFETDDKWNTYIKDKAIYEKWKPTAKDYKIDVYSYYDFSEKWRGFKRLYHINKLGIIGKKIEGNCVFIPDKIEIGHRKFQQIIVWEGFRDRMISEELEITKMILHSIAYLSELEKIPLLEEEVKKKDKLLEMQRDTIRNIEDDIYIANIKSKSGETPTTELHAQKWLRNVFMLIIVLIGLFMCVIMLLVFGII